MGGADYRYQQMTGDDSELFAISKRARPFAPSGYSPQRKAVARRTLPCSLPSAFMVVQEVEEMNSTKQNSYMGALRHYHENYVFVLDKRARSGVSVLLDLPLRK
jgi:hypothetical protein